MKLGIVECPECGGTCIVFRRVAHSNHGWHDRVNCSCGFLMYGRSQIEIEKKIKEKYMERSLSDVYADLDKCRKEGKELYIKKLEIKSKIAENNIKMTKLRMEEDELE